MWKREASQIGEQIDLSEINTRSGRRSGAMGSVETGGRAARSAETEYSGEPISPPPELIRRRQNRKSTVKSGRTIGEQREHLEKASERQAKRKKSQRKRRLRIAFVSLTFILAAICLMALYCLLFRRSDSATPTENTITVLEPTIPIVDEDAASSGHEVTQYTKTYVAEAEADFRELGYTVEKAVIPTGAIREIDFYLQGQPGRIKFITDRGSAESVEDADRLIRYLKEQGVETFEYLDVRLAGRAYYK